MGKRGPKPKSPEIKAMEGNPGHRAIKPRVDEEDVSSRGLRMPQRLTVAQREIWRETVESMPEWWFTKADKMLLIEYCRTADLLDKAASALEKKSAVQLRANGSPCVNPQATIRNNALAQLLALSDALGLTRAKRKGQTPPVLIQPEPNSPEGGAEPEFPAGVLTLPSSEPKK